jgi:HEAT repeat protein
MPLIRKDAPDAPAPPAPDPFLRLVQGDADERWRAARALDGAEPRALGALTAALAGEADARVREAILTALARTDSCEALAAMLPLLRSDEAERRTAALDAMRAMPTATVSMLPELLEDADPDVRVLACELARQAPGEEAQTLLCALLDREADVNVCAAAVEVLAEIGEARALPALRRCAARHAAAPFLGYAIEAATRLIAAQTEPPRG